MTELDKPVRRVVTGAGPGGARFVHDGPVEATRFSQSGHSLYQLWGADRPRLLPDAGDEPEQEGLLPPAGGYRFSIFVISPSVNAEADPGMHGTSTTDVVVVLAGEVDIELDGGEQRTLRAGDTLVQNGSPHRWVNRSGAETRVAVFTVGAVEDDS